MAFVRGNWISAWLVVLSAAVLYMAWGQAASEKKVTDFEEINVHRINIIEPDGKPRVIISNRARMAGLYWGGKEYKHHSRDAGGFLFFNNDGDEVGGMVFTNSEGGGYSGLKFDQYKQQEALELAYGGSNGRHEAGLVVFDQPNESIFPAIELSDKLSKATTEEERKQLAAEAAELEKKMKETGAFVRRFYAGKTDGNSMVRLSDGKGRPRLMLKVDPEGAASIEFLDEAGQVVQRIPEK